MPQVYASTRDKFDISFMPSLECNLECSFCMYRSSPRAKDWKLPLWKAEKLIKSINWDDIGSVGFYGGEPTINLDMYEDLVELAEPFKKPMFMISNGSFTTNLESSEELLEFLLRHPMRVVVSGTGEHKAFQDTATVNRLRDRTLIFIVKDGEQLHPMGRLQAEHWTCTQKCIWVDAPTRLALFPTGHIIMSNCDGVYPVVGTFETSWEQLKQHAARVRAEGCKGFDTNVNDLTKELK